MRNINHYQSLNFKSGIFSKTNVRHPRYQSKIPNLIINLRIIYVDFSVFVIKSGEYIEVLYRFDLVMRLYIS